LKFNIIDYISQLMQHAVIDRTPEKVVVWCIGDVFTPELYRLLGIGEIESVGGGQEGLHGKGAKNRPRGVTFSTLGKGLERGHIPQ